MGRTWHRSHADAQHEIQGQRHGVAPHRGSDDRLPGANEAGGALGDNPNRIRLHPRLAGNHRRLRRSDRQANGGLRCCDALGRYAHREIRCRQGQGGHGYRRPRLRPGDVLRGRLHHPRPAHHRRCSGSEGPLPQYRHPRSSRDHHGALPLPATAWPRRSCRRLRCRHRHGLHLRPHRRHPHRHHHRLGAAPLPRRPRPPRPQTHASRRGHPCRPAPKLRPLPIRPPHPRNRDDLRHDHQGLHQRGFCCLRVGELHRLLHPRNGHRPHRRHLLLRDQARPLHGMDDGRLRVRSK